MNLFWTFSVGEEAEGYVNVHLEKFENAPFSIKTRRSRPVNTDGAILKTLSQVDSKIVLLFFWFVCTNNGAE